MRIFPVLPVTAKVDVESRAVPPYVLDRQYWASVPVKWLAENTWLENVTTIVSLLLTSILTGVAKEMVILVGCIVSMGELVFMATVPSDVVV
mgnify:CR=1 FL=1